MLSEVGKQPLSADDLGAERVRTFYERHPYPAPVDQLDDYRTLWQDRQRRRAEFHLTWPADPYREDQSILVAGCGTSQAAKHAMRWPSAHVTGIDFSAASVGHTEALKQKHELHNLEVHCLPIQRVGELGTRFDQIVCTGVLHHIPDPGEALQTLSDVLRPGGAMHLMVYAPYGRTGIYMLQDFCRRVGIDATPAGIQDLVRALGALPAAHPLATLLREAPDFRREAALADALLHPQDRAYSVPQLFEFLETGGLRFGRWVRQAPYDPRCGVLARIPQAPALARLPLPEQYAAVELFRGTMLRHSVVAYREEAGSASHQVGFTGDDWPGYVPIRMPDATSVRERLPAGAAAVLINRTHTHTDLYLPIDAREKRWLDAIDGQRTIGEIAGASRDVEATRSFFERLYRYDQVVFDASRENTASRLPSRRTPAHS
jgi:SAM-dependent methyltransferase